jgi:hypothetical protein
MFYLCSSIGFPQIGRRRLDLMLDEPCIAQQLTTWAHKPISIIIPIHRVYALRTTLAMRLLFCLILLLGANISHGVICRLRNGLIFGHGIP